MTGETTTVAPKKAKRAAKPKPKKEGTKREEPSRKNILRIPTADAYAYIEVEFDGSSDDAVAEYHRLTAIVRGGDGLEPKEFNAVLDELMTTNKIAGDPGMMDKMSLDQQVIIQAIKRSRARTNK